MHSTLSRLKFSSIAPHLKTNYLALLGLKESTSAAISDGMEKIRHLMLSELGYEGQKRFPAVTRRIRYAQDIQALWYARSDVMAILSNTHGETIAREKVACISGQFNGLLPKALAQRAGPRNR